MSFEGLIECLMESDWYLFAVLAADAPLAGWGLLWLTLAAVRGGVPSTERMFKVSAVVLAVAALVPSLLAVARWRSAHAWAHELVPVPADHPMLLLVLYSQTSPGVIVGVGSTLILWIVSALVAVWGSVPSVGRPSAARARRIAGRVILAMIPFVTLATFGLLEWASEYQLLAGMSWDVKPIVVAKAWNLAMSRLKLGAALTMGCWTLVAALEMAVPGRPILPGTRRQDAST